MRTAVKAWVLKVSTFMASLIIAAFGFVSSIIIFSEISQLIYLMGYTNGAKYAMIFFVGFTLIWLVTLTTDSAHALMLTGFRKAEKLKGENNEQES